MARLQVLRREFPHLNENLLDLVSQERRSVPGGYISGTARRINEAVTDILRFPNRDRTSAVYLSDMRTINEYPNFILPESMTQVMLQARRQPVPTPPVDGTFEKDTSKAISIKTYIREIDQISLEHIIDYYYKCRTGHAFAMQSILERCSDSHVDNCKKCYVCNASMEFELYKQPDILSDIKSQLYEFLLTTDDVYDPERISAVRDILQQLALMDVDSIIKEAAYYEKQIGNQ